MMRLKAIHVVIFYTTIFFILTPLLLYVSNSGSAYHLYLALVVFISNLSLFLGYKLPLSLPRFKLTKIVINPKYTFYTIVLLFITFVLYTFYTFKGIPLFMIISGEGDPNILRGELFKGRQGFEILLLYLSAIFTYVFVPLAILLSYKFQINHRTKFLLLAVFFCITTLQKALLLNLLIPLFVYFLFVGNLKRKHLIYIFSVLFSYFIVMIILTGHGDSKSSQDSIDLSIFFSSSFAPSGGLEYFVWRVFAVPIYTAVDTMYVFFNVIGGEHLLGGTSNLFSFLFGVEKVELEKIVFEYQFGGFNPLANANTTFSVVLFVDFSYIGVVFFSVLLGVLFRLFERSGDLVLIAIGYLLAFKVLNAPLVGLFFSAGFIYFVFHIIFLRFKFKEVNFAK
ncbi:O-antigen polymerase [Vibrio cholerae]|uniref:O-antigen polymerase n=1 Tax=Vibrio cholerae TaxID=666 RepID=UPI003D2FD162